MKNKRFHIIQSSHIVDRSISKRFRDINIFLFLIVTVILFVSMSLVLGNITNHASKDYARLYAENAVSVLNTYLNREIAIVSKAAKSDDIINWFDDEDNPQKKLEAYNEMKGIIEVSSSKNLYLGIEKTMHEYTVERHTTLEDVKYHATLLKELPKDNWYFECVSSDKDYLMNVDIDKVYRRKRVWLNYKVARDGVEYGVICTALEFSQLVENLFSEYESKGVRSLIIDEEGYIQMDSALLGDAAFLSTLNTSKITDEFTNRELLDTLKNYTKPMENPYNTDSITTVLELSDKKYQYATIAPIASTTWAVVTLYNSSALLDFTSLLPLVALVLVLFILFVVAINKTLLALLLKPFYYLVKSIEQVQDNYNETIYGLERNDEIGDLANTIHDMKTNLVDALSKVHYDALTGVHNRRYLDETLSQIIEKSDGSHQDISILMMDIDYFKKYNDAYGHTAGDACLQKVASVFSNCLVKPGDFVVRYGGEEFSVVLPNTDAKGACVVAEKILSALKREAIEHSFSDVCSCLTLSIGIATCSVHPGDKPEDYIRQADTALYASKASGRNRYTVYDK